MRDELLLERLRPDALLLVGDLGDGDLRLVKRICRLDLPVAVILGNHDQGRDPSGELFQRQLMLLGERHCGWRLRSWSSPPLAVVGGRPGTSGGGYYLSRAVEAVYGPIDLEESARKISTAALSAPSGWPLILLAHSGPTGLGSDVHSPCGRDWKSPPTDWGDQDLALALDQIRSVRSPDLVVFGHMHHILKRGKGMRRTFHQDRGIAYLNAAWVPRHGSDDKGRDLCHFSWAEFDQERLIHLSHRWFNQDGAICYQQSLLQSN